MVFWFYLVKTCDRSEGFKIFKIDPPIAGLSVSKGLKLLMDTPGNSVGKSL